MARDGWEWTPVNFADAPHLPQTIPLFLILRSPIVWYNWIVKMILPLLLLLFSCGSFAATETLLHSCPPPDTEYETNLVAEVWDNFDRIMDIRFEFTASPLNNVQAAFGVDEDHDGVLCLLQVILR